jgi:hypothetical protein
MTAQATPNPSDAPALVVFGRDEAGKPHASSFTEAEAALAEKAAKLMNMSILPVTTEAERALAARVPKGRVFGTGKAFVPFIKPALFVELQAASLKSGVTNLKLVAAAQASGAGETPSTTEVSAPEPIPSAKPSRGKNSSVPKQPCGWGDIEVGAVVLGASSPRYHAWYECVVIAVQGDDRYTLRYCDWPDEAPFVRRRVEIGLLHPAYKPEPPLEPEPPLQVA